MRAHLPDHPIARPPVLVQSWGRLSAQPHTLLHPDPLAPDAPLPRPWPAARSALPFGLGRSYGDVCLNPGGALWATDALDHWIAFDEASGVLHCQVGVALGTIQRLMAPRGWMLPVTPGTQFVTVGGAIANDVHGKNHHRMGSFGAHVKQLRLRRTDRTEAILCGPDDHSDWFAATVGGLGLTGLIADAQLQLRPVAGPWLRSHTQAFTRLEDFYTLAAQAEQEDWEYTVAWIDCLHPDGRGLFMRANHCSAEEARAQTAPKRTRRRSMPLTPPLSLVNPLSLRAFNTAYYHLHRWRSRSGEASISHYLPFFYPLDGLEHWNRMYGPRGFYQYQCVVPFGQGDGANSDGARAIAALLAAIAESGQGSFLAVLKTLGPKASVGMLGFAREGITLALDFPNRGDASLQLFARLDAIVRAAGGSLYPAKDARMPADLFAAAHPRLAEFLPYRDPGIDSAFARRVLGTVQ